VNEKAAVCGAFAEPSDGLEPSTPSLPWNFLGNRWQPVATDFACFRGFEWAVDLPAIAAGCNHKGLHKGSIRSSLFRQQT
jgi:hypothetical protein